MRNNKLWKVFSFIIAATFIVICIYLMIGSGSSMSILKSYDAVKPDSTSGFSKQLQFVESYTRVTQDTTLAQRLGISEEDAEAMANGETIRDQGDGDSSGPTTVTGTVTDTDITAIAKAICQSYLVEGVDKIYSSKSTDPTSTVPYNDVTYNGKTVKPYIINNHYMRCCNGLCSSISVLLGVNVGSSSFRYISCDDFKTSYGTSVSFDNSSTFGILKCGDVICVSGHVETVVKVTDDKVYIASAGKTDSIKETADKGYCREFEKTKTLSSFYSSYWPGGVLAIRRP